MGYLCELTAIEVSGLLLLGLGFFLQKSFSLRSGMGTLHIQAPKLCSQPLLGPFSKGLSWPLTYSITVATGGPTGGRTGGPSLLWGGDRVEPVHLAVGKTLGPLSVRPPPIIPSLLHLRAELQQNFPGDRSQCCPGWWGAERRGHCHISLEPGSNVRDLWMHRGDCQEKIDNCWMVLVLQKEISS